MFKFLFLVFCISTTIVFAKTDFLKKQGQPKGPTDEVLFACESVGHTKMKLIMDADRKTMKLAIEPSPTSIDTKPYTIELEFTSLQIKEGEKSNDDLEIKDLSAAQYIKIDYTAKTDQSVCVSQTAQIRTCAKIAGSFLVFAKDQKGEWKSGVRNKDKHMATPLAECDFKIESFHKVWNKDNPLHKAEIDTPARR